MTSMIRYVKIILMTIHSLYSCQECGGICQINEDMKTDGQRVIKRLANNKGVSRRCPYCGEVAEFRRVTRNHMEESIEL